jgi:hypothetical protein
MHALKSNGEKTEFLHFIIDGEISILEGWGEVRMLWFLSCALQVLIDDRN